MVPNEAAFFSLKVCSPLQLERRLFLNVLLLIKVWVMGNRIKTYLFWIFMDIDFEKLHNSLRLADSVFISFEILISGGKRTRR